MTKLRALAAFAANPVLSYVHVQYYICFGIVLRMKTESTGGSTASTAAAATTTAMLDRQDFIDMNRGTFACTLLLFPVLVCSLAFALEMHEYDEMREQIIKRSREILKARYEANK